MTVESIDISGATYPLATRFDEFLEAAAEQRRCVFKIELKEYAGLTDKIATYFTERFGEGSNFIRAVFAPRLICAGCSVEFPGSYVLKLQEAGIGAPGAVPLAEVAVCPHCGCEEGLYVYANPSADEITQADLDAIRSYWRRLAVEWWKTQDRNSGLCDDCMATVFRPNGYVSGSSFYCDECTNKTFGPGALEKLREHPDYFGSGVIEKARALAGTPLPDAVPPAVRPAVESVPSITTKPSRADRAAERKAVVMMANGVQNAGLMCAIFASLGMLVAGIVAWKWPIVVISVVLFFAAASLIGNKYPEGASKEEQERLKDVVGGNLEEMGYKELISAYLLWLKLAVIVIFNFALFGLKDDIIPPSGHFPLRVDIAWWIAVACGGIAILGAVLIVPFRNRKLVTVKWDGTLTPWGKSVPPPGKTAKTNAGTWQGTVEDANTYWKVRNLTQKFDPFLLYKFDDEASARAALLGLDCISEDGGALACRQPLTFGYYATEDGGCEAILAGEALTGKLYRAATSSFKKHGGVCRREQEP